MITITNFEHRVNVIQWLKTEGLAHYEREDHWRWGRGTVGWVSWR